MYTNELVPLAMTDQFHQDQTGQLGGDGQKGRRFKKIHRAYRLRAGPETPTASACAAFWRENHAKSHTIKGWRYCEFLQCTVLG